MKDKLYVWQNSFNIISQLKEKSAFTLAEVLITLGIIGVVAAMTIPGLMQAYTNHVVETRLEEFYSTMNQAIRLAEYDYGEREGWYQDISDSTFTKQKAWLETYLMPYLKGAWIEEGSNNRLIIYFLNGSAVEISKNNTRDWHFYAGNAEKCQSSGNYQYWNYIGKCAFSFYWNPASGDPTSYQYNFNTFIADTPDYDLDTLKNHSNYGCNNTTTATCTNWRAYCTRLIQLNGWKIPKDYPFKVHVY